MLFIYNYIAHGATTYPGLHNHTAVHSKEYASPTHLARSTSGKVPPARFVDRSPSIRPAHGNHIINHPTSVQQSKSTSHSHPSNTTTGEVIATTKPTFRQTCHPNTTKEIQHNLLAPTTTALPTPTTANGNDTRISSMTIGSSPLSSRSH